ncbi:MAG: hypothetical protein PF549_01055 [Patescibacteria group bacterium]|nr:hypothetical protein [Patescibacteria group bacterium]
MEDKEITLIDERLYGVIYWFCKLKLEKCIASNKTLAELVKTTPSTIQNSLTKLENKDFIFRKFKDEARKHRLEIIPLVTFGKVSLTKDTKDLVSLTDDSVSLTDDTVVSLTDDHNKNTNNKNIKEEGNPKGLENKITPLEESKEFFTSRDKQQEIIDILTEKGYQDAGMEIMKFISYWTERNKSGTKQRWEMEKTFEVKRRIGTWLSNNQKFNKSNKIKVI